MVPRKPTADELRLLAHLISRIKNFQILADWVEKISVEDMNDDGMGSLRLDILGLFLEERSFGRQGSECKFIDVDGVEVIASLYLDQNENLFELDIWKANFDKVVKIPQDFKDI